MALASLLYRVALAGAVGLSAAPALVADAPLTFEALGAKGDGKADDGALISAGLARKFGTLAQWQNKQRLEIHATSGRTYRLATPIMLRQARLRLFGHGAILACQNSDGIVIDQGQSANQNAEGSIEGFRFDDCATGIRATAAAFWRIADNSFFANGTCIDFNGLSSSISGNYCRGQREELEGKPAPRPTTGIIIRSARTFAATSPNESFANIIHANRVYHTSGNCIALIDGGGHTVSANDCEMNTGGEVLLNNSFGNAIDNLYSEPSAGSPFIIRITRSWGADGLRQETAKVGGAVKLLSLLKDRYPEANRIIGGTFGGGAIWDIDVQTGNFPIISGVRYGTGKVHIGPGINGGYLMPGAGTPQVTNESGASLLDMSQPGQITGARISGTGTAVRNAPGFADFTAGTASRRIDLATPEFDAAYHVELTAIIVSGSPTTGALQPYLCALPTASSFRICLAQPPGNATVRIQYRITR